MYKDVVREAIEHATKQQEQPAAVAKRLNAWYEALVSGNESLDDRDAVRRRVDMLIEVVSAEDGGE